MANDRAVVGDWNVICHRCSRKIKASRARKEPRTGLYVCQDHLDYWHPLERGPETPEEDTGVPWSRSRGRDKFVIEETCSIFDIQAIAGIGVAGCAKSGLDIDLASEDDNSGVLTGTFPAGTGVITKV